MDCDWKLMSAGMWFCAFGCVVRDYFIFRITHSKSLFLGLQAPEGKGITTIRNVGNFTPKDTAPHARRFASSAPLLEPENVGMWLEKCFLFILVVLSTHCYDWPHSVTHTHTHGRTPLVEGSARRRDLYLTKHNTQQETDIHAVSGIRTHNSSKREAADLRLRPRGHWDRPINVEGTWQPVLSTAQCHVLSPAVE